MTLSPKEIIARAIERGFQQGRSRETTADCVIADLAADSYVILQRPYLTEPLQWHGDGPIYDHLCTCEKCVTRHAAAKLRLAGGVA